MKYRKSGTIGMIISARVLVLGLALAAIAVADESAESPFGKTIVFPPRILAPASRGADQPAFTDDSWKSHRLTISLAGRWRFAVDPDDTGVNKNWQSASFDDASWGWMETGKSWQGQGLPPGYAWYRAQVFIPQECSGSALELKLGDIEEDDEVFFNGVRIGGMRGDSKYINLIPRSYPVVPSQVHYGKLNSVAVRVWGCRAWEFHRGSGLLTKDCRIEIDPYRLEAVARDGEAGKSVPIELFDLTAAQQDLPFNLVLPLPAGVVTKNGCVMSWTITDIPNPIPGSHSFDDELFPASPSTEQFGAGHVAVVPSGGAVDRCVIPVDAAEARRIYLNGRFEVSIKILDAGNRVLYSGKRVADRLCFARRDDLELPRIKPVEQDTPFGRLTLIDEIDAALPMKQEKHPYLESGFEASRWRKVPGTPAHVAVHDILGRSAREIDQGWFAYRIGRGRLIPGQAYLLRIEYPEDKRRYWPIELETGHDYSGIGWKDGAGDDNPYDNWPLSHTWRWHDAVVIAGERTLGSKGALAASGEFGFWVYFMNKVSSKYFTMYEGGPAVARLRLYALDAEKNAPQITRPAGLPERTLMFDWEHQPLQSPEHLVRYARLMGYNAMSPLLLKWAFSSFGESMAGYDNAGVDQHGYGVQRSYDIKTAVGPDPAVSGVPSIHRQFLDATKGSVIRYIPRIEYGGSYDLPEAARAIGPDGKLMPPNRFMKWGANLLHPATWEDLKKFLDAQIKPFVAEHPQLAGILWRIRCDRMSPSYGASDLELFAKETNTPLPPGDVATRAAWAYSGAGSAPYREWWLKKRAAFHYRVRDLLTSYRPGMEFLYYNWDTDDFSIGLMDFHTGSFYRKVLAAGNRGAEVYSEDAQARRRYTAQDYVNMIRTGKLFSATPENAKWRKDRRENIDSALDMDLYRDAGPMRLLCPANYLYLSDAPAYLNYFKTVDGLAVANPVEYDELGRCSVNPHFECNMITPGGGNFSMALELLAYFHGDARTLTWTVYTYARSFAAEHRRFAQAFLALPAIPGTVVDQGDKDVKVRTYPSANGTYVGVAYRGYEGKKVTVSVPAKAGARITNLVTSGPVQAKSVGDQLQFEVNSGPMELHAYLIQ